ncbi:type IX secretion system outer membrane channel protein PorV [Halocola ammonii]
MLRKSLLIAVLTGVVGSAFAQLSTPGERANEVQLNTITTAVPFLMIAPDSRAGALGDAGVASSPDASAMHWNPAKLSFTDKEMEFAVSYSPWLRQLVNDMNLGYLTGYKKLNDQQAVAGALRYFSLGSISFTDNTGNEIRTFQPNEFSLDVAFSQKLSERFSGGVAARYIHSNLTGGTNIQGVDSKPGRSVAVDISAFYTNDDLEIGNTDITWNWGVNISNIGAKMSYTQTAERDFIPTNLRLGTALTFNLDQYNDLGFLVDFNKLLVPTPPVYDPDNPTEVLVGKNPDVGVATAIFQSFTDAPGVYSYDQNGEVTVEDGSVLREELREINIGGGVEYWYDRQFAFRAGYFYEHLSKGNRQFITLGAGLKYQVLGFDLSYLISTTQQNPLANTLRFTLRFELLSEREAARQG